MRKLHDRIRGANILCRVLALALGCVGTWFAPPWALALEFDLPLACKPGQDCWIARYVDLDPSGAMSDYACGQLGSDGHKGTDFAIPHLAAMEEGVPVLAMASGIVKAIRDGMVDVDVRSVPRGMIAGRECGNGMVITHGGGFETQYCHLKRGSLTVIEGDEVSAGQEIGLVGLSGDTSFPHVHVVIYHDDKVIDPFRGIDDPTNVDQCALGPTPLWRPQLLPKLKYQAIVLRNVGFASGALEWDEIQAGVLDNPPKSTEIPALLFVVDGFYLKEGDELELWLEGPNGWSHRQHETAERSRATFFRFSGRKAPSEGFSKGTYHGGIVIRRHNLGIIAEIERAVELK